MDDDGPWPKMGKSDQLKDTKGADDSAFDLREPIPEVPDDPLFIIRERISSRELIAVAVLTPIMNCAFKDYV